MTGSKSICLYADTDGGKTAQAGRFARWVYEATGRVTRAIIADQGGSLDVIAPYIQAGIIEPLYIGGSKTPLDVLHKLAKGCWPENGRWTDPAPDTWSRVGAYIIDSGTECAEMIKDVSLRGSGVKLQQEPSYTFQEGETKVHGGNRPYFGFAQDAIVDLIRAFNALPVARVLWTFGESKGTEDMTGRVVYGPQVVGIALTDKLPKKFGDLLHLGTYQVAARDREGKEVLDPASGKPVLLKRWRIHFSGHLDGTTGVPYPAKPRVPPELLPELFKRWPGGYLSPRIDPGTGEMVDGLDEFLRVEGALLARPVASVGEWKGRVDEARRQAAGK